MLWAIVDNKKVAPSPGLNGICPGCNGKVIAKCGKVNTWHWSHHELENCDPWYEPESNWHFYWKMTFGKSNTEVIIKKGKKWHIADILTQTEVVIELQNSPIDNDTIQQREEFYGDRMLWIINGKDIKNNFKSWKGFHTYSYDTPYKEPPKGFHSFEVAYPRRSWTDAQRDIFIDFGERDLLWVKKGMGSKWVLGKKVSKKQFINKYVGDYNFYLKSQ